MIALPGEEVGFGILDDMNGDGNVDFITTAYFTKNVGWVENPGKAGAEWTYHDRCGLPGRR